jgi:hypothetical protein
VSFCVVGLLLLSLDFVSRVDADSCKTSRSKIVVTEGFLILVDPETSRQFDLQFFLRGDYATLKQRRIDRQGYVRPFFPLPRLIPFLLLRLTLAPYLAQHTAGTRITPPLACREREPLADQSSRYFASLQKAASGK